MVNRVQEILDLVLPGSIRHVAGIGNPTDLCSRGASAATLRDSEVWCHGPTWLPSWSSEDSPSGELSGQEKSVVLAEIKRPEDHIVEAAAVTSSTINELLSRYSSFDRLVRVTALLLRFTFNSSVRPPHTRRSGDLTADEIRDAKIRWIKLAQADAYSSEISLLARSMRLPGTSKLIGYPPFLDVDGLLKLVDRARGVDIPKNALVLLPAGHRVSHLVIEDSHRRVCHSWIKITYTTLLREFWIINGSQEVRRILAKCFVCKRMMGKPFIQPPGPLPAARCTVGDAFDTVGIDFAGPLHARKHDDSAIKVYICLFTCARTRAVHLELTTDLTMQRFIMAFDRFVARRGLCREIYSNNAKTFKKADVEFK